MLEGAGIAELAARNVVSNEDDVKGVVQKVSLGEADAGIVYRTDVTPALAGTVRVVAVPEALNVAATYPIAVLASSDNGDLARDFVSFVLGPGRAALQRAGFTV
jgi:molybdate transport system substrate-binding protein